MADDITPLKPVVIMGRGHSGTRVLAWLCTYLGVQLGTSTDRETADADDLKFTRRIKKIAMPLLGITREDEVSERDRKKLIKAVDKYYNGLGQPDGLWGWKFPETYLIAPLVRSVFPEVRMLHLVRDGRDIAFKNHLTDDPGRPLGKRLLKKINALDDPHPVQAIKSWAWQVEQFEAYAQTLPEDQVLTVSFEDLCNNPLETGQRVCDFLGTDMNDKARNYLETGINTAKVSQYREHSDADIAEVQAAAEVLLKRLGYLNDTESTDEI